MMRIEKISGFGEFEFHKGYFIGRIYEGIHAGIDHIKPLSELIARYYSGAPIVYISDRFYTYSIDMVATKKLIDENNIGYVAVVNYSSRQTYFFSIEKRLIDNIQINEFHSLDLAIAWAKIKALELSN